MGIRILNNEAAYPARRACGEMKRDVCAKVVKVKVEGLRSEPREQQVDYIREAGE
jgi:hypothetical protein